MKSLNKIIFINSAGINYGEIELCGNVHITGTQGVGKTTILRAILFFYTADKEKRSLGLRPEKDSFDEFYLPYNNSYIAYEVIVDDFKYTVVVFKHGARAAFRFIDAPFDYKWLCTEDGHARSNWNEIFEQLGDIHSTKIIQYYNDYRNILFGKNNDREMAKYGIIGSSDYDNIIRSIQNVFLNDKIDSDFIKNTIISSLSATEPPAINLKHYRSHLKDFKREYEDIRKWYTVNKDGNIIVRKQADTVIKTYDNITGYESLLRKEWAEMNFAIARDLKIEPLLIEEIKQISNKIDKLKEQLSHEQNKANKEKEAVIGEIAILTKFLKDCKEFAKEFEDEDMGAMEALCNSKDDIEADKHKLEQQLSILMQHFQDIEVRYMKQKAIEDAALNDNLSRINEVLALELQQHEKKLQDLRIKDRKVISSINKAYEDQSNLHINAEKEQNKLINNYENQLNRLQYIHPRQKELEELKETLRKIDVEEKDLKREVLALNDRIENVQKSMDLDVKKEDFEYNSKRESLVHKLSETRVKLSEFESQLKAIDGSLYDWLESNVEGWQNNIGRIVDEQKVLLSHNLSPIRVSDSSPDTVYGVKLRVENIEPHILSPQNLEIKIEKTREEIREISAQISALEKAHDETLNDLRTKYRKELESSRAQLNESKALLSQIPNRRQDFRNKQRKMEDLDRQELESLKKEINEKKSDAMLALRNAQDSIAKLKSVRDSELKKQDRIQKSAEEEENSRFVKIKSESDNKTKKLQTDHDARIKAIDTEMENMLKGKGADTEAIGVLRNEINEQQKLLDEIKEVSPKVQKFHFVSRQFFVLEDDKKEELKRKKTERDTIITALKEKETQLNSLIDEALNNYNNKKKNLDILQEGLSSAQSLQTSDSSIPVELKSIVTQVETDESCQNLCVNLRSTLNALRDARVNLSECCRIFRNNFSPENTFHFPEDLITLDGLKDFASNVKQFIEEDKISQLSKLSHNLYSNYLIHLAREVEKLAMVQSRVQSVIRDINHGLEDENFVSAIESIEIQTRDSDSTLMSTLKSIQTFVYENSESMGESNLFSGDDHEEINRKEVHYLQSLIDALNSDPSKEKVEVGDIFKLQFRIVENGRDLGWQDRISNVGSDGTDILAKAMINIMLINVFMRRGSNGQANYYVHCMMDEIGKLHPENVNGILHFAGSKNIHLINSSPMTYNIREYRYTYVLYKDKAYKTHISLLLNNENRELYAE